MATKKKLGLDDLLFPITGRVASGAVRKTEKMMRVDLAAARKKWNKEGKSKKERMAREKTDFLAYCNDTGSFADFHANRHLFITSLERAGISPKMAQTLARHSDIRLTLGVYTHVGRRPAPRSRRASGTASGGQQEMSRSVTSRIFMPASLVH